MLCLVNFNSIGSTHLEQEPNLDEIHRARVRKVSIEMKNPATSRMQGNAPRRRRTASIGTHVKYAMGSIGKESTNQSKSVYEAQAKHPRYTRGLLWEEGDEILSSTARWSISTEPAPDVPPDEFLNGPAVQTLLNLPYLFCIKCPVNVGHLQSLLADHLNPLLVESVCHSLCKGFWPWASTKHTMYPTVWDNSKHVKR